MGHLRAEARTVAARARRIATALVVAGLALGLTACFPARPSEVGRAQPDAVTPVPEITDPSIVRFCPPMVGAHLDGVIAPNDRVFACRSDVRFDTDGVSTYGPWQVAYLLPHPERLLAAYAKPNATALPVAECGDRIVDPLLVWVDLGGEVFAYYAPVDGCGAPTRAAATAYRSADRTIVADVDTGIPGYQPTTPPSPGHPPGKEK